MLIHLHPIDSRPQPIRKGQKPQVNPFLLSQLRAAINRGETVSDGLDALFIRQPALRRAYAEALATQGAA